MKPRHETVMERSSEEIARTSKVILVLVALILSVLVCIFIYFISRPCRPPCDTSTRFGNENVNGTYRPDALAMTLDGKTVGRGIETAADPPAVVFSDDFEGSSPWSGNDHVAVDSPVHYWGSTGSYFDPAIDGSAVLSKTFSPTVAVDADEAIELYFYVNATSAWDTGDDDYFIARISFTGGKCITYVIMGDYSPANSSEAVISVTTQVTAKGLWAGINIQKIDDDYIAQFSGSLPIPAVTKLSLILDTSEPAEGVYLDELQLVRLPKEFAGGSYWKKVPTDEHVISYFVEALYKIHVSPEIDPSNTHVEIKLWIEVYDSPSETSKLLSKTLIQDEVVTFITVDTDLTWTSKVFALPKNDAVLGGNLYYSFSIQIEAWGEFTAVPGSYAYAVGNADGFDHLQFQWTAVTGSIDVIIYTLSAGAVGGGGIALVGIRRKRSAKDLGIDERESMFN